MNTDISQKEPDFKGVRNFIFYLVSVFEVLIVVLITFSFISGPNEFLDLKVLASFSENRPASPAEMLLFTIPPFIWMTSMWNYFSWKYGEHKENNRLLALDSFSVYLILESLTLLISIVVSIYYHELFIIIIYIIIYIPIIYLLLPIIKERGLRRGLSIDQ